MERPTEVPVLIIGGGPVGLTAAMLLARHGVEPLLLERRGFTGHFPRAHLLNVRTMEVFHDVGVADDIYAAGPRNDNWRKVTWYTSVGGPTPLHGRKIGEVQAWGGGTDAPRYAQASPRRFTNLPQIRLDRLLWEHADAALPGRIRGRQEVVGLDVEEPGATVTVTDRESGETYRVRARYVLAADGGRASAGLLGVEMEGPRAIRDVVNQYVESDMTSWSEPDALLAHFIAPAGQGRPTGVLQALGPDLYGRDSTEWLVAVNGRADAHAGSLTPEPTLDTARRMLGLPADHPMTRKSISHWQYEGVVATRFRHGPVFLAGDAAHRHPPTGGLGLNCGVQDAHNLAWKLAAVLHGHAGEALLDTYEAERRPIAAFYTAHSLENASRHAPIAAALGLRRGQSEEEGWREIAVWAGDTPEGERRRAAVALAVAANADDYSQLGVEAGFAYEAGAVVPDGSPPPPDHDSPVAFTPTSRPGHHVPHVWLGTGDDRVSTVDLVDISGFTVFTGASGRGAWQEAAAAATQALGCRVSVVVVGAAPLTDDEGAWADARGVAADGAVLVRPDRVVAWRGPVGAAAALTDTLARMLGRDTAASGPAPDGGRFAEPFLERIRHAGVLLQGEGREVPTPS